MTTTDIAAAQAPIGYADLKALATEHHRPLSTLIALSDDNDPHLADRPGRRLEGAQWFAALWDSLEVPDGIHLRRLHYMMVSTPGTTLPNGLPYINTYNCWKLLGSAAADARYLDLVPCNAFVDRRAPEPIVYVPHDEGEDADLSILCTGFSFPAAHDVPLLHYTPRQRQQDIVHRGFFDPRWVGLPAKPQITREGTVRKDERGKVAYTPILEFTDKATRDAFSARVVQSLLEFAPAAFEEAA